MTFANRPRAPPDTRVGPSRFDRVCIHPVGCVHTLQKGTTEMSSTHRPRNPRATSGPGGWAILTFDCTCGMTDDTTTGRTVAIAEANAAAICEAHAATVTTRVTRAIGGTR